MDRIVAEVAAFFIKNGMTVSDVSRQLGITRATVYAKLRKYDLFYRNEEFKPTITPSDGDLLQSSHCIERSKLHGKSN